MREYGLIVRLLSICAPSRAVILTGKHNHLNGQLANGQTFDETQQIFPKFFQKGGYQTATHGSNESGKII